MLHLFRSMRQSRCQTRARSLTPTIRLTLEPLESRDLLSVVPLPPTGVVATGTSASAITVNWNASTDPNVTGYDVYEKIWIVSGGGKGSLGGHLIYVQV